MKTRQEIIDFGRTLIGTPYHHQGRLPGVGLDCMGLLYVIGRFVGIDVQDVTGYSRVPDGKLDHYLLRDLEPIRPEQVQPGDVLSFWIRRQGLVQHVGLTTDVGLLHTWQGINRVVEHGMDERWQKRVMGCYRVPGVADYHKPYVWAYDPRIDPRIIEQAKKIEPPPGCCG